MASLAPALPAQVFERLARGDTGDPQEGPGEYQSESEDAYRFVDLTQPARDVHRQVRAWSFMPPISGSPGRHEHDGTRVRVLHGPLWIVESEPA